VLFAPRGVLGVVQALTTRGARQQKDGDV
jgi:hypothetical protein